MIEFFTVIMGLLAALSIYIPRLKCDFIFLIVVIPMVLISGLRWEMGTDWTNYYNIFASPDSSYVLSMEPGYRLYVKFIKYFTDSYSIFLLITDGATIGGLSYLIFRYSGRSFLSLFYSTGTLFWYAGSLRQMLSLVFLTISLRYVFHRKPLQFFICMALAFSFHKSSLFFLINYFIYNNSFIFLMGLLGLLIILIEYASINFDYIVSIFYEVVSIQFRLYAEGLANSNPWLGIPRKLFNAASLFYFYKKIPAENIQNTSKLFEFYFKMVMLSMFFYIIGAFFIEHVSSRMDIFTGFICIPILIGMIDSRLNKKSLQVYFFALVVFLNIIFYLRLEFLDLYHPYSYIFYNSNYIRELY
ncbi:EpsG family protein [Polynucleobacter paneuropaeus]|nr:EpsG family protein [Polynucleobacter paneuropaeus]MBT8576692.1 EpsG family protein [Polynucleobacter paneuropaeus]